MFRRGLAVLCLLPGFGVLTVTPVRAHADDRHHHEHDDYDFSCACAAISAVEGRAHQARHSQVEGRAFTL